MYIGTLVWQVLEEGRLSTCKLYVYIIYIRVLLCVYHTEETTTNYDVLSKMPRKKLIHF